MSPWARLAWRTLGKPLDVLVDLSATPAAYVVAARRRHVRRASRVLRHLVEEFSELVGAETPLAPRIILDARAHEDARAAGVETGPLLVLAPGAAHAGARWPAERFAAAARRLVSGAGPLAGARIVILGAETDSDLARELAGSLDADGVSAISLAGRLNLMASAALLERATLFIGNDGPLAHVAAAMNVATLGLYGPSDERVRGPYGARARALRGRPFSDIMAEAHGALTWRSWVEDVSVDAVEEAADALMRAGGLG
jgi:ADP-heptose:LPS heptosyltransferase